MTIGKPLIEREVLLAEGRLGTSPSEPLVKCQVGYYRIRPPIKPVMLGDFVL